VKSRLKETNKLYFFIKEALALRGIPDVIGCYRGRFFAWELKKSEKEANKKGGRIALQRYILKTIRNAGGVGEIVFPENFEQKYQELLEAGCN
jgi:hypothetical protein